MQEAAITIAFLANINPTHPPQPPSYILEPSKVVPIIKVIKQIEPRKQLLKKKQAVKQVVKPKPARAPVRTFGGNCDSWIAGAGITDLVNARELIGRESGCNPYARNPSSGACGVAQELPCGKSGCALGDGACQVRWMNGYVLGRYGSWSAAVAFHNANNYY